MNKKRRITTTLLLVAVLLWGQVLSVSAAEPVSIRLPVQIIIQGDKPVEDETYEVVLEAIDINTPMPEDYDGTQWSSTFVGEGTGYFEISYTTPGVYYYRMYHKKGANENCTYCSKRYDITVSVFNSEKEEGALETQVAARRSDEGADTVTKVDIEFTHTYAEPIVPVPDPDPTPDPEPMPTPETPKAKEVTQVVSKIRTGDHNDLLSYIVLAGGSLLVISAALYVRKKKEQA